jgi:UDP-hydrolysing UDP-N-acetyl-D-glucosamine 2-epimerase
VTKKIVCHLTSRGNYSTFGSVLHALDETPEVNLEILVSGASMLEKYGTLPDILDSNGLSVTREMYNLLEGGSPESVAKSTGLALIEMSNELSRLNPDGVVVIGDRYETMATTLAASYLNIPVIHYGGGEISGSIDDKVRHATTKFADYHMVVTEQSRDIVLGMGESRERVFYTGGADLDFVAEVLAEQRTTPYDPQQEYEGVGTTVDVTDDYLIVQYHPVHTEHQKGYDQTVEVLEAIRGLERPVFWFRPNMDAGTNEVTRAIEEYRSKYDLEGFKFFVNLEPKDYLRLVEGSACFVGNSTVGLVECSFMGQPAVNIGTRQQGRERAENVVDVECEVEAIRDAVEAQISTGTYPQSELYGDGQAGQKIADIIINRELTLKEPMSPDQIEFQTDATGETND